MTSPENARYLLSALAQSQAAVFAILVSLSFVAIQISDRSISFLVIKYIKKNKYVWLLSSLFLLSIALNIFFISKIEKQKWGLFWVIGGMGIFFLVVGTAAYVLIVLKYLEKEVIVNKVLKDLFSKNRLMKESYDLFVKMLRKAGFYREVDVLGITFGILREKLRGRTLTSGEIESIFKPLYELGGLLRQDHYVMGINQLTNFANNLSDHTEKLSEDLNKKLLDFIRFVCTLYIQLGEVNQFSPIVELFLSFERVALKWLTKPESEITEEALYGIAKVMDFALEYGKLTELRNIPSFSMMVSSIKNDIEGKRISEAHDKHLLEIIKAIESKGTPGIDIRELS